MAFRVEVKTTGGGKFKRHLAEQARRSKAIGRPDHDVAVGFKGRNAGVAYRLEFGEPSTGIPERPVMRAASRHEVKDAVEGRLKDIGGVPGRSDLVPVARAGAEALRASYLSASKHLEPVGERQERRKRGTEGEDRPLVGAGGPVLIESIKGYVGDHDAD